MNIISDLIAYEQNELSEEAVIELFQELINTGQVWRLSGHYGRVADAFLEAGLCTLGEESCRDYYGNYIPSKHEVKPGTKGSQAFVDTHVPVN